MLIYQSYGGIKKLEEHHATYDLGGGNYAHILPVENQCMVLFAGPDEQTNAEKLGAEVERLRTKKDRRLANGQGIELTLHRLFPACAKVEVADEADIDGEDGE